MTKRAIIESILIAILLTALSYGVGLWLGWIVAVNWLEAFAVFTSYSCTWLCTKQSRWNYPIGVITTLAWSILFFSQGLLALAIFNLYLVGSQIYGWYRWGKDTDTRPVTKLTLKDIPGYGAFGLIILIGFIAIYAVFSPGGLADFNMIDIGLAVFSGVAQLLMDNKRIDNWPVWGVVNIVSIPYFLSLGFTLTAFQYIFFLANNFVAYFAWKKTMEPKNV